MKLTINDAVYFRKSFNNPQWSVVYGSNVPHVYFKHSDIVLTIEPHRGFREPLMYKDGKPVYWYEMDIILPNIEMNLKFKNMEDARKVYDEMMRFHRELSEE